MMLLEIDNFEQFKIFFDVVYDITELIELQLFKSHMTCTILDKAHTRFMSVEYKSDFFASYEIDDVESVTLFADDVAKIIKSVNKIDNVVLQTNEDYLICRVESRNGNSRVFEFVLPAEHIESPHPPSLDLPVSFTINLVDLKQAIKDLKIVKSDILQFNVVNDLVGVTAGVETTSNYVYNIISDVKVDYNITARYSLAYVEQLLKFEKISKTGEFSIDSDFPLLYSFEDEVMGVKVSGLIAPRVEVE